ncbi:unnamed protein product [Kuraishia capsulata CBS 1993]|uniref:Uncharacterized protein n=1 Tax=Kuraishia capsulata CBS 1993 TaxID=1382522 RepID=W6MSI0_9ASCO|nr:uncharacterized protein KUCA_T00005754001 [Kuraishia capsulata CBS 1993]CDK29761.1 unnamed protein product [Kuraishia capsulata CBS 1993]
MNNLFVLLGNDEEGPELLATKEVVKKSTSSKKADVPPPSADKSRAKKKAPLKGNEGAIKVKNENDKVSAPASTERRTQKSKLTRQQTGKTDSARKEKAGWGDDADELDDELAGEKIAEEDAEEAEEEAVPAKSLEEYLAEVKLAQESLGGTTRAVRQVETDAEKTEIKAQEEFAPATASKKQREKARKVKNIVEFDAVFADEVPPPRSGATRGRGGARGSSRGGAPRAESTRPPRESRPPRGDSTKGARGGARGRGAARAPRGESRETRAPAQKLNEAAFPAL